MKKLVSTLVLLLIASPAFAGGLQASFIGSRLPNARSSHIFRYDGTVDGTGNLIDTSGENLFPYSKSVGDTGWSRQQVTVTINAAKNPLTGSLDASLYHEDGTNNVHSTYVAFTSVSGNMYVASVYARAINRNRIIIQFEDSIYRYAIFDLTGSGSIVSSVGVIDAKIVPVVGGWYRCWIVIKSLVSGGNWIDIGIIATTSWTYQGIDTDSLYIYGPSYANITDGFTEYPGIYHETTAGVTKPRLDLAPTGAPPSIASHLQASDGNRLMARSFDGATQYYSRAHANALNINDQDHTYTFAFLHTTATSVPEDELFLHSTSGGNGILVSSGTNTQYYAMYGGVPAVFVTKNVTSTNDGLYHILQLVRSDNIATLYVDGIADTPSSVLGSGLDISTTAYLGAFSVAGYYWSGQILYSSLDNRALSAVELQQDREDIWGILAGHKGRTSW